jgi:protein involved in polysaccharide export with SLBB domain
MSQNPFGRPLNRRTPICGLGRTLCLLLLSFVLADCAQGNMQPSNLAPLAVNREQPPNGGYKLDAGDRLRVIVFGEMDLGGEYEVDGSGFIRLPLIGQVRAAGLALYEFENSTKSALERGYLKDARVSVEVINYRPFYILGQVNKPGEYPYVNGISVLSAVALAGGYTYRANEWSVYLRRRGTDEQRLVPADQVTLVQPGDIITVRERFF